MNKMRTNMMLTAILLAWTTLTCAGCGQNGLNITNQTVTGSENYVTKEIKIDGFDQIKLNGSPKLVYTQQEGKPTLAIHTSDNLVDLIDIRVEDGTLTVGLKRGYNIRCKKLEIHVTSPTLKAVNLNGSGEVTLTDGLKTDQLAILLSGSGDIEGSNIVCQGELTTQLIGSGDIDIDHATCSYLEASVSGSGDLNIEQLTTDEVRANIAGSGDVKLTGTAEKGHLNVAGSGDLSAANLVVRQVTAIVSGSGDIECHATDCLKATVNGSGSVGYKGDPKKLEVSKKHIYKL